jgi:hypothetical protein
LEKKKALIHDDNDPPIHTSIHPSMHASPHDDGGDGGVEVGVGTPVNIVTRVNRPPD